MSAADLKVVPIAQTAKAASAYFIELTLAMGMLAKHPQTLFVGQAVRYPGQIAYRTFELVPQERRIEMPVAEDFQLGLCAGLALEGFIPLSFFPRWDFLILAANQMVNHLDKFAYMGWDAPKVIIRTAVGKNTPLDPGPQHTQDHTEAFRLMLQTVSVMELTRAEYIVPAYLKALQSPGSFLIVERQDMYG